MGSIKAKFILNGTDLSVSLAQGGIAQEVDYRNQRSITTLDGSMVWSANPKIKLKVTFHRFTSERLAGIASLITQPSTVTWLNQDNTLTTRQFWVAGPSYGQEKVIGGRTIIDGATLELTER